MKSLPTMRHSASPDTTGVRATFTLAALAAALIAIRLLAYRALAPGPLSEALCHWDCDWYMSVAQHGYDRATHMVGGVAQANWAFFPLFPLCLLVVRHLAGVTPHLAGMLASTFFLWLFAILGARYLEATRGPGRRLPWLLMLAVWPYGFYFDAAYSEALYGVLATVALLALARRRVWPAAMAIALLTATRPTGILLAVFLAIWLLAIHLRLSRPVPIARTRPSWYRSATLLLPAMLAATGLLAFMAHLWLRVGDPLAFVHIQAAWGHRATNPLVEIVRAFTYHGGTWRLRASNRYNAVWALIGLGAAGHLAWKGRLAEAWFCGATVLMSLGAGSIASLPRFVACNPAFMFWAADLLESPRLRSTRLPILAGLGVIQAFFVLEWFRSASFLI